MSRHSERREWQAPAGYGISLEPVAGWYRHRLRSGSVAVGVHVWFGQPTDPVTGESLDRSLRWQCSVNGQPFDDFERIWPACAGDPISQKEYARFVMRQVWARNNAPDSAYAEPGRKIDPLSRSTPMQF